MKEEVLKAEGPDLSESTEGFPEEIFESQKELIRQSGNNEERKRKKYLSK